MLLLLVICLAAVMMSIDWWAVGSAKVRVEEFAKPLTMIGLVAVALVLGDIPDGVRPWIVGALVLGMIGDIFLLPRVDQFEAGLASFLVGHLLYVVALIKVGVTTEWIGIGLVAAALLLGVVGRRILKAVAGTDLFGPVLAYNLVISAMAVAAFGTANPIAIVGALAFAASDSIIGYDRFVSTDGTEHRIPIIVLYHLGQVGLVAGMAMS